jgi:steroid delta-isomerase-like uncharacterized protein
LLPQFSSIGHLIVVDVRPLDIRETACPGNKLDEDSDQIARLNRCRLCHWRALIVSTAGRTGSACLPPAGSSQVGEPATSVAGDDLKEVDMDDRFLEDQVRAHFGAWNRHDAAASVAMLAPDCVFCDNGRKLYGREAVLAATRRYFDKFPDLQLELISLYIASHAVLTEWRVHTSWSAELTGVPAPHRTAYATGSRVDEFNDDGQVRRCTLYWETDRMLHHFGIRSPEAATAR